MSTKIALIDDDPRVRNVLKIHLQKAGYSVMEAEDAEIAMMLLEEDQDEIGVVICDLKMPKMTGFEALDEINQRFPTLPVIVLTGLIEPKTAVEVLKQGAFDFLTKPVKRDDLLNAVEQAVSHKKALENNFQIELESRLKFYSNLVMADEMKDPYRNKHGDRSTKVATQLAQKMGLSGELLNTITYGARFHDIGMVGINDQLLQKRGELSRQEYKQIQEHPKIGASMIQDGYLSAVMNTILNHHERFDGRGYPAGLKGEVIPLSARIVAVADAYVALTSKRPFREAHPKEQALSIMMKDKGKAYCPTVLDVFLSEPSAVF